MFILCFPKEKLTSHLLEQILLNFFNEISSTVTYWESIKILSEQYEISKVSWLVEECFAYEFFLPKLARIVAELY